MQRNKKLKEKLIALQEDIEKNVSIVTILLKCLYNVGAVLDRAWHITARLQLDSHWSYSVHANNVAL